MLACTRSLMNRASRSSTYSSPHIICSSEARPILLLASSSPPGASAAKTADTDLQARARGSRAISSGLGIGTPGTYQVAAGSSSTAPPAAHSTICATRRLAGAAALAGPGRVHHAADRLARRRATQAAIGALADAVAVADLRVVGQLGGAHLGRRPAEVEQQLDPLLGQRQPAVEGLHQERDLADVADQGGADQPVVADDDALVDALARLGEDHELVVVALGRLEAHRGHVDAGDLELRGDPRAVVRGVAGSRPVMWSASTLACSHSGATSP